MYSSEYPQGVEILNRDKKSTKIQVRSVSSLLYSSSLYNFESNIIHYKAY